jgi:hypothetical protein
VQYRFEGAFTIKLASQGLMQGLSGLQNRQIAELELEPRFSLLPFLVR